jgi:hypothetical protein
VTQQHLAARPEPRRLLGMPPPTSPSWEQPHLRMQHAHERGSNTSRHSPTMLLMETGRAQYYPRIHRTFRQHFLSALALSECTASSRHLNDGQGRCPASIQAGGGGVRLPTVSPVDSTLFGASTRCAAAAGVRIRRSKCPRPDPSAACFWRTLGVAGAASLLETDASDSGSTRYLSGISATTVGTVAELAISLRSDRLQVHAPAALTSPAACGGASAAVCPSYHDRCRRRASPALHPCPSTPDPPLSACLPRAQPPLCRLRGPSLRLCWPMHRPGGRSSRLVPARGSDGRRGNRGPASCTRCERASKPIREVRSLRGPPNARQRGADR